MYYHPQKDIADAEEMVKRQDIIETSRRLIDLGLNRGTSGNVSVRSETGFVITPSGIPVEELSLDGLVKMDMTGKVMSNSMPSSEWQFHLDIYRERKDVQAIIHTHSMYATTIACAGKSLPPFHYMIAVAGGCDVRCAPYALFGSKELSEFAVTALEGRKACLLANHGMIAVGKDLTSALAVAVEVEALCEQYSHLLKIGAVAELSEEDMAAVLDKFNNYGSWNK